ncbi:hypothetical protein PPGU19_071470 (plasmid) [Paraburkholderia sp. PGU19]|nr:hypothetical protein PPGU19_071470 [Paraburkholderia sp. PGU19]
MTRFAIPAIEATTADIYARVKNVASARVPNSFGASGYLGPGSPAGLPNAESVSELCMTTCFG